jgi:hypothetical protein
MSLWGLPKIAPNAYLILYNFILVMQGCLVKINHVIKNIDNLDSLILLNSIIPNSIIPNSIIPDTKLIKISANKRIGPHNKDVLSILFGSLLGNCHAEYRNKGNGTRFCFYQESSHATYLIWLHSLLAELGYCNNSSPEIKTRLGKKGVVRKIIRFKTWTYSSLNWIHELWYPFSSPSVRQEEKKVSSVRPRLPLRTPCEPYGSLPDLTLPSVQTLRVLRSLRDLRSLRILRVGGGRDGEKGARTAANRTAPTHYVEPKEGWTVGSEGAVRTEGRLLEGGRENVKIVPSIIGEYLTPLALAIWIMEDGSKMSSGLKLCTNSFSYSDCLLLVKVLFDNFNLKSSVISAGTDNQYNIYIWKQSMPLLREIVVPYVHPSMKYKLGN